MIALIEEMRSAPITQAPAPMQSPLPGSTIMQAPSQGVGAAPAMVRPPVSSSQSTTGGLMIRPRGVEENKAGGASTDPTEGAVK